jgi:ribonuclease P protein component
MSRGARKAGLSRRHRFSGRGAFAPALRSTRKLRGTSLLLHLAADPGHVSRVGLSVPKRLAPLAVDRNRLKRIAREAFRQHPARHTGLDLVFTPREKFVRGGEDAWRADFIALLDRAAKG